MKNLLKLPRQQQENYTCKNCGYTFPKAGANISGWKTEKNRGNYVRCPNCGTIVERFL